MSAGVSSYLSPAPLMALASAGGIVVQVFLAGNAIFGGPTGWDVHGMVGGMLGLPILCLAIMGLRASGRFYRGPALLLATLYLVQIGLVVIGMETGISWLAALHPANALALLLVATEALKRTLAR